MATLTQYITETRQLLQNPNAPTQLYSDANLTSYINRARGLLAGDSECIRVYGTLALTQGVRVYSLTSINVSSTPGIDGALNARILMRRLGDGNIWMRPRNWPWFAQYKLNNPVPQQGVPSVWTQYGQGETGSLYVDPVPDSSYVVDVDTVCRPVDLVDDTTPDAIPYPFDKAVPFFACYYALLAAQSNARQADADRMKQRYEEFKNMARSISNPDVLPQLYEQHPDLTLPAKLGMQPRGQQ